MVVKLYCLMASHGYPPGVVLPQQDQCINKAIQDCQPILPCYGVRHEFMRVGSLNLKAQECEETWKPIRGLSKPSQFVNIDSAVKSPLLTDVKDAYPSSMLFSSVIAEHCTRHEKIMQFLMSGATELEGRTVDLALLSELMGLQSLRMDSHQQPTLLYPGTEPYAQKPLLDIVGDLVGSSRITIHPDGQVLFNGTGTEVRDILSVVAEFYLPKNSAKWKKQSMLVPRYSRLDSSEVGVLVDRPSLKLQATTVAPLKSPEKVKVKSPTKKRGRKVGRERDLYKKNYFRACENLLSIMVDKRKHGKTAFLSLKKCGPELPELLTQFSAGIAGIGLAVLFSVVCKLACLRVTFCATRLFNTGLGFGLFWLSWAVNKLRDTIVYVNKNQGKLGLKEEEMMNRMDKSVKEISFRAATLMAVAVLRFA